MNDTYILYEEFMSEYINSEVEYYPDAFLRHVHQVYLEQHVERAEKPLYITWNITNKCNLTCSFCSANAISHKSKIYDKNTLEICDQIIKSGVKYVSILGGEPTLNEDIAKVINKFLSNNIFTEVVSNGYGVDKDMLESISKSDLSLFRIKISLDSYDKYINDLLRGNSSYDIVTKSCMLLSQYKIPFRINMVVNVLNQHQIKDTYVYANKLGANSFGFSFVMPIGRGKNSNIPRITQDLMNQLIWIKANSKGYGTNLEKFSLGIDSFTYNTQLFKDNLQSKELAINISKLKCTACKYRLLVNENGDIFPCDMLKFEEFKLGNILVNNIKKVWKSQKVEKISRISRLSKRDCNRCDKYWCNSGCFGIMLEYLKNTGEDIPMCLMQQGRS